MTASCKLRSRFRRLILVCAAGTVITMYFIASAVVPERSELRGSQGARENSVNDVEARASDADIRGVGAVVGTGASHDSPSRQVGGGAGSPDGLPEGSNLRIELVSEKNAFAHTHLLTTSAPPHFRVVCRSLRPAPVVRVLSGRSAHAFIGATLLGPPVARGFEWSFSYSLTSLDKVAEESDGSEHIRIEAVVGAETVHRDARIACPIYGPQLSFMDRPGEDGMLKVKAYATISDMQGIADLSFRLYVGEQDVRVSPLSVFVGVTPLSEMLRKEIPIQDKLICVEFWALPEWEKLDDLWAQFQIVSVRGKVFDVKWRHVEPSSD